MLSEKLDATIKKAEKELTFWDTRELERQTCMSINTIKDNFFNDEGFPKHKIGGKCYFPEEKTRSWLLEWIESK